VNPLPSRAGRNANRIAEEVIARLTSLVGTKVTVTLEVEADILMAHRIMLSVLSLRTAGR